METLKVTLNCVCGIWVHITYVVYGGTLYNIGLILVIDAKIDYDTYHEDNTLIYNNKMFFLTAIFSVSFRYVYRTLQSMPVHANMESLE